MMKNTKIQIAVSNNELANEIDVLLKDHPDAINRVFTDGINVGIGYGRGQIIGYVAGVTTVLSIVGVTVAIIRKLKNKKSKRTEL